MGTIDEIKNMRRQGKSEPEIHSALKARGVSDAEIVEGLSQTKIKDAVGSGTQSAKLESTTPVPGGDMGQEGGGSPGQAPGNVPPPLQEFSGQQFGGEMESVQAGAPASSTEYSASPPLQGAGRYEGMEESMMGQEPMMDGGYGSGVQQDYSGGDYGGFPDYQGYQQGGMSSDVIKEISEQIVGDRLAVVQDKIEEAIKFKIPAETKLKNLDDRLRKIEQVLDKLQLSILHRVGEYVTDVKDIKNELVETQKSFKSLLPHHHARAHAEHRVKKHAKKKGKKRVP